MLPIGWAYLETVFKFRRGPKQKKPQYKSQYNDGRIGWLKWGPRAQESLNEWIYDEENDQLLGMSQSPAPDYQERRIPRDKSLHFVTTSAKGNPEGRSVLRNAYRSWYMKTNIEDLEGIGLERDMAGYPTLYLPLEIMKRETAEAEEAYQMYLDLVTNVRRDEAEGLLLPAVFDDHGNRLYEFKLLSSSGTRQFDTSRIITRYESRMALTIMADFLLLGQQKQGSYALSETKARMFYQALTSVLDNIAETINSQAVPALFELNPWWDLDFDRLLCAGYDPVPEEAAELGVAAGRAAVTITPYLLWVRWNYGSFFFPFVMARRIVTEWTAPVPARFYWDALPVIFPNSMWLFFGVGALCRWHVGPWPAETSRATRPPPRHRIQ